MNKKKVAFICVHNSCRSQIAEAFGRHLASGVFESYSAGTETKPRINQDAVRIMKELYGIDMEGEGQYSKLISDIPKPYRLKRNPAPQMRNTTARKTNYRRKN